MLYYFITVTEDLVIPVTLISLLCAFCSLVMGRYGRLAMRIGIGAGILASAVMAVVKNTTKLISTSRWNPCIFLATVVFSVLFLIFSIVVVVRKTPGVCGGICSVSAAGLTVLLLFLRLPDVMAYPKQFDTGEEGILSVSFLVRLIGWLLTLILLLIFARYLCRCAQEVGHILLTLVILEAGVLVNAVRCFAKALGTWTSGPKWLPDFLPKYRKADYPWAFPLVKFVANNTTLFVIIIGGLGLLLALLLFIRNLKVKGFWENPAQHRKLRAACRRNRRHAATVIVCFVIALLNLTVVRAYNNREVELSEPEEYTVDGDNIYILVDQVSDGHLHRFEYTTENNIAVRWIIVRKSTSAAYGVGLDACDICGDAGYYERNGQIVCKRCDVVMNTNTIGFAGGCNPIPLDFVIEDGQFVISVADIVAGEKEFK